MIHDISLLPSYGQADEPLDVDWSACQRPQTVEVVEYGDWHQRKFTYEEGIVHESS